MQLQTPSRASPAGRGGQTRFDHEKKEIYSKFLALDAVTLPGGEGVRAGLLVLAGVLFCAAAVAVWIAAGRIGEQTR